MDRRNFFTFLGFTAIAASEAGDKNLLALTAPSAATDPADALPADNKAQPEPRNPDWELSRPASTRSFRESSSAIQGSGVYSRREYV
jgi:hypothetical protein